MKKFFKPFSLFATFLGAAALLFTAFGLTDGSAAFKRSQYIFKKESRLDEEFKNNILKTLQEGQQTFRYDTFGDEEF